MLRVAGTDHLNAERSFALLISDFVYSLRSQNTFPVKGSHLLIFRMDQTLTLHLEVFDLYRRLNYGQHTFTQGRKFLCKTWVRKNTCHLLCACRGLN